VPTSAHADLILSRLRCRRERLAAYAPEALELAAAALAEMHGEAHGHVAKLRADRSPRLRVAQLQGEKVLGLEDLAAIALEGDRGRLVAIAGLRMLAAGMGCELVLSEPDECSVPDALGQMVQAAARTTAGVVKALADGHVDKVEAASLCHELHQLKAHVAELDKALLRAATSDPRYLRRA
jgi:hypothetical protein